MINEYLDDHATKTIRGREFMAFMSIKHNLHVKIQGASFRSLEAKLLYPVFRSFASIHLSSNSGMCLHKVTGNP